MSEPAPNRDRHDDEYAASGVAKDRFDAMYETTPPWDIGRPQPEFVRRADAGEITGDVLDVGCGTGDNAIFFAQRGHAVLGVDFLERPIQRARAKADGRSLSVEFRVHDALDLAALHRRFDTITDCGLFHTLSDAQRPLYVASLASAIKPGGRLILMCFSEAETRDSGPRRVTQGEIRAVFADGWHIDRIEASRFDVNPSFYADGARAWLAVINKA